MLDKPANKGDIDVDKTLGRGDIKFAYKILKLNEHEKKELDLDSNNLNLLILKYIDAVKKEREFIIGSLNANDMKVLFSDINDANLAIERINLEQDKKQYINKNLNEILNDVKKMFEEKYNLKYTQEGFDFMYANNEYANQDCSRNFVTMMTAFVPKDTPGNTNFIVYDDVDPKEVFMDARDRQSYSKNEKTKNNLSIELSKNVVSAEELGKQLELKKIEKVREMAQDTLFNFEDDKSSISGFILANYDLINKITNENKDIKNAIQNIRKSDKITDTQSNIVIRAILSELRKNPQKYYKSVNPKYLDSFNNENEPTKEAESRKR